MASLLLSFAGHTLGAAFGPAGAVAGRAIGALAGGAIDRALFGGTTRRQIEGPRLNDLDVMGSTEGAPIPRLYGRVLDHYGTARIGELGLDRFGGCLNVRRMRGGSAWSTHAWGAAFDFDPARNQLKWTHDRAQFARPEYEKWWSLWEAEGFISLGRARDFDWMHIQAARL